MVDLYRVVLIKVSRVLDFGPFVRTKSFPTATQACFASFGVALLGSRGRVARHRQRHEDTSVVPLAEARTNLCVFGSSVCESRVRADLHAKTPKLRT